MRKRIMEKAMLKMARVAPSERALDISACSEAVVTIYQPLSGI